jgi:D-alanyl-D-alanine carboxypeptidase/D-alanyl-D-alanine-endopeptidase (penicillin-binding protein 4)
VEGAVLRESILFLIFSVWLMALPQGIEKAIKHSGIPKADISIVISEAGTGGKTLATLAAEKIRQPASVMKVLTLYAALLELGYDHRWKTAFYYTGRINRGVLEGDLIIKGYGDPTLSAEDIPEIVSVLKQKGIRKITGHIVIDRSYFHVGTANSSHFDEYVYSPYNAMPDAMMFNERVSTVCIDPKAHVLFKKGADASYEVIDQTLKVNKACRGRYAWPTVKIIPDTARPKVLLKGKLSQRCGERRICKVLTKPYLSFYYALKEGMKKAGIQAPGSMRLAKLPGDAKALYVHYSRPLEEILAKTAKESNNLYARHLLLYLGAKRYGAPATLTKGRAAVREILREHGTLGSRTPKIDNGSGLSRSARLDAKTLARVLDHAYTHEGRRWMQLLSIAGVDGTIKKRFRGTVVKNRAWMKTGTLRRVKNIAGYVENTGGRVYTVVILVNTTKGRWKAAKLQDDIITWLVRRKGPGYRSEQTEMAAPAFGAEKEESVPEMGSGQRYYIQAGAFGRPPEKAYLLKLEKMGMLYKVRCTDKYRVRVGPYAHQKDALEALHKIRTQVNPEAFLLKDE